MCRLEATTFIACSLYQNTSTMPLEWYCDYCLTASFPSYRSASRHELTCPARFASNAHTNVSPHVKRNDRSPPPAAASLVQKEVNVQPSIAAAPSAGDARPLRLWKCGVCLMYLDNPDQVAKHEKTCLGLKKKNEKV